VQPEVQRKDVSPFGERTFEVAELKATGSAKSGRFEAIVSVFGNVDSVGDRMMPGSFVRTLKAPPEGRGFPPIVWSHLWGVVPIGASMRAEEQFGVETPLGKIDGLFIEGQLLVDDHQTAREVYAAMRTLGGDGLPPLREFSFGYRVVKAEFVSETPTLEDGTEGEPIEIRDIYDVDLFEVGPTLVGMNDATALLGVKSFAGAAANELADLLRKGTPLKQPEPKQDAGEKGDKPDPSDVGSEPPDPKALYPDPVPAFARE
jgi:HK97 family phage prohead protease